MRIGIDIDDTVSETSELIYKLMLEEDKKKRNTGILDDSKHILEPYGRFDWSGKEIDDFLAKYFEANSQNFGVVKDAKKFIDRLLDDGNEIYFVTARSLAHWKDREKNTESWLQNHDIKYTKLIFSKSRDKTDEIKNCGIDLMIDDSVSSCLKMKDNGIVCLVRINSNNYKNKDLDKFKYKAEDWKDIYKIISENFYEKTSI